MRLRAPGAGKQLAEVCDRCGAALDGPARIENLVHLQNVSLKIAQRITCDEEERQRFGYKLVTSYRFPEVGGKLDRKDAEVYSGDTLVMRLSYGDATDLYRINLGWANQRGKQPPGFNLDLERGYWSRNPGGRRGRRRCGRPRSAACGSCPTSRTPRTPS